MFQLNKIPVPVQKTRSPRPAKCATLSFRRPDLFLYLFDLTAV